MALGKKDSPSPPDFGALADKQTQQNRPNQSTPFGSTSWSVGPDGRPTQTTGVSSALQPGADAMQSQVSSAWANPLDNGEQARTAATKSLYNQATSRLDPAWNQREQSTNASLAAQGLDPTSEAGGKVLDQFGRARNDAYTSAENSAVSGGANAAAQQQQLDLNSREAPLSALSSLKSLLQMPGFGQAGDFIGAGQDQFADAIKQFEENGGALGGFGQLLGALGPLIKAGGMKAATGGAGG